jgi:signal transduction histidine kinase
VKRESGDPTEVVMEAVDAFRAQAALRGVSLDAQVEPAGTRATFDPARILQVLTTLVSEAIKRTATGGAVHVRVESSAGRVRVTVSDSGPAIPADELPRMFDRFRRGQAPPAGSTSLRLYICKCIVQHHGGEVWATANAGGGNTFGFTLVG